jgi:RNA-directed DNA polymerase
MPNDLTSTLVNKCATSTGLTEFEVLKIAKTAPKRYKVYEIPKRSGGSRTICHPSRELKLLQYVFLREILCDLPVHQSATAYKKGSSIKQNAMLHAQSRVVLKLDFESFFPSINTRAWSAFVTKAFAGWTKDDIRFSKQVLFWGAGTTKPVCLSIGAPTSPIISNAMMYAFDELMHEYATEHELVYSRYADDIAISSRSFLNKDAAISHVTTTIRELKLPILRLNAPKTKLVTKASSRRVTGIILNNDGRISLGRERKRSISAMVHKAIMGVLEGDKLAHLSGLLSFAADVEPTFIETLQRKYGTVNILKLQF